MKAVLMSTQPKWCADIANLKKPIEVRKSRPKLEITFKVYIYCTKGRGDCLWEWRGHIAYDVQFPNERPNRLDGKVIGEFICNRIDEYTAEFVNDGDCYEDVRRHWIDDDGEEDFEIITSNGRDNPEDCELFKNSCLSYAELKKYIGENFHDIPFYAWHITDLKIYDKPKELSEFFHICKQPKGTDCLQCIDRREKTCCSIKRPPQSWCYVEE